MLTTGPFLCYTGGVSWQVLVGLGVIVAAPWFGIITAIVIQAHQAHRIAALEEKMDALTGELGWKKE